VPEENLAVRYGNFELPVTHGTALQTSVDGQ